MEQIKFSHEFMMRFADEFDAIKTKYDLTDVDMESDKYEIAWKYENMIRPTNLEKHPDIIDNTSNIYGDFGRANDYSILYKKILDKFVLKFLGIPGLSSLYNEHYIEFEWYLHVDQDFTTHRNCYRRDHFIHEIRTLTMAFTLLEADNRCIYHALVDSLFSSKSSKVGKYSSHQKYVWLKRVPTDQKNLFKEIYDDKLLDEHLSEYFCRYVVLSAITLSCLFHDIGYPVSFFSSLKEKILRFIPTFHSMTSDGNFDFNCINSMLQESLLFQTVDKNEIQERFYQNDHGTISAILLGVFFYNTGKVYSLTIEQQTAVELAILAIYNHTLSFGCCSGKKSAYYKMQFRADPISFLLRLCDDAQEWDREYFEIKPMPNLCFCATCRSPIRRETIDYETYLKKAKIWIPNIKNTKNDSQYYEYSCRCKGLRKLELVKKDDFTRRKLVNIKVCKEVAVTLKSGRKMYTDPYIEFDFRYDNYKLLRLCRLQTDFTKYRCNDMVKLKKYVRAQPIEYNGFGYKWIFIKHNLTPNPFLLKMFILRDFLDAIKELRDGNLTEEYSDILKYYNDVGNSCEFTKIRGILVNLSKKISKLCYVERSNLYKIVAKNVQFYFYLLVYEQIVKEKKPFNNYVNEIKNELKTELKPFSPKAYELLVRLYDEAIDQIEKTYIPFDGSQIGQESYYTYLKASDSVYSDVEYYCMLSNDSNPDFMLYDTDFYLFSLLNDIAIHLREQAYGS